TREMLIRSLHFHSSCHAQRAPRGMKIGSWLPSHTGRSIAYVQMGCHGGRFSPGAARLYSSWTRLPEGTKDGRPLPREKGAHATSTLSRGIVSQPCMLEVDHGRGLSVLCRVGC